jgi:FKBP-type peptidyl-prolyl cis-trans isomerase
MTFKICLPLLILVLSNPFLQCADAAWTSSSTTTSTMPNLAAAAANNNNFGGNSDPKKIKNTRRQVLATTTTTMMGVLSAGLLLPNTPALAAKSSSSSSCTDIETCREIGEKKDQASMAANPVVSLGGGLQYKMLRVGMGDQTVSEKDKVKIIYSISQANGDYMYSRGFGYNKIDAGNGKKVSDWNIDSLIVHMMVLGRKEEEQQQQQQEVPIGIQQAMMGMKRGERRRIIVPPLVGFETSNWNPQPVTFRERQQIQNYRQRLQGRGDTQPPFPAPTIWDVEVLSIRN